MLAGCGGGHATVAGCLDAKGFLVQGSGSVVRGTSTGGVSFTLRVYATPAAARHALAATDAASVDRIGDAVVDFSGNPPASPGAAPGRLSKRALATIRSCLERP